MHWHKPEKIFQMQMLFMLTLMLYSWSFANTPLLMVRTQNILKRTFVCVLMMFVFVGLQYGNKACCGIGGGSYNFNQQVPCGNTKEVNGQTLSATACQDPYNYVSWDGVHVTEAANKIIANAILNDGSNFDPPFSLHKFCDIQPIG